MALLVGEAVGAFLSTWFLAWLLGMTVFRRVSSRWRRELLAVLLAWIVGGLVQGFGEGVGGFQARVEHMLTLEELWRRTPGSALYLLFAMIRLGLSKDEGAAPPAAKA